MWRPKDWVNPYQKAQEDYPSLINYWDFEHGADEILKALEKEAGGEKIWFGRVPRIDGGQGELLIYTAQTKEMLK